MLCKVNIREYYEELERRLERVDELIEQYNKELAESQRKAYDIFYRACAVKPWWMFWKKELSEKSIKNRMTKNSFVRLWVVYHEDHKLYYLNDPLYHTGDVFSKEGQYLSKKINEISCYTEEYIWAEPIETFLSPAYYSKNIKIDFIEKPIRAGVTL